MRMSLLALCSLSAACALSSAALAQGSDRALVPLLSIIQGHDTAQDPAAAEYVAARCAAFYMIGAAVMNDQTAPEAVATRNADLALAASFRATASQLDMKGTNKSKEEAAQVIDAAVARLGAAYMDQMNADNAHDGGIGHDPIFLGDSEVCKRLSRDK